MTEPIPYTPQTWTPAQRAMHEAPTLDLAFHFASQLAGGWYRRPVSIDCQTFLYEGEDPPVRLERYMLRPSEVEPVAGWQPCYEIRSLSR